MLTDGHGCNLRLHADLSDVRHSCYLYCVGMLAVTGGNIEQQMMYAGSMNSLVNEVGLSKVLVSVVNVNVSANASVNVKVNVDLYSASSLN